MPLSAVAAQPHLFLFFPNCLLRVPSHSTIGSPQRFPSKLSSSLIRHVSLPASASPTAAEGSNYPSSAAAVVEAIRRSSPASPVEFTQRVDRTGKTCLVLYSSDFQGLCMEQLELFLAVVDPHAALSVYVRPAGSYVMDQLELRRVIYYPGTGISQNEECVIVVGNFSVPGGLHIAEIAISRQEVEVVAEFGAIVFPLVKHPFVVGFLVAELPKIKVANCATFGNDQKAWEPLGFKEEFDRSYGQSTSERRLRAVMISRSLATAYVMDQVANQ
ncbi:chloroplast sensor kinase, chloroplastic-like isoform X1 [Dendrobium catenatum]|uniref:chloroplast sensor kinase, chloroplastic-like isoform X1 n=1 Tax=Dendrobium catenatum TaxID=906689 RepID=UPI0010A04E20|nr:chloroplast sensor kinase, chloroplastic-like isoform X1 [Dendrobium catenatum]